MSAPSRLPRPPRDDDDVPPPGSPIQDPVLSRVKPGPDVEPAIDKLLKGKQGGDEAATGGPPAGRTTFEQARRRGPMSFLQILGPGLITGASDLSLIHI